MAIDWDTELLGPVMAEFGEGDAAAPSSWPLYLSPSGGQPFPVPGAVYDAQYQRVTDLGDGVTATSSHPVLGVRDAVFAAGNVELKQNGKILFPGSEKLYSIIDVQPDGHGHTLLILIEAAI